jgi:hypothetical protein
MENALARRLGIKFPTFEKSKLRYQPRRMQERTGPFHAGSHYLSQTVKQSHIPFRPTLSYALIFLTRLRTCWRCLFSANYHVPIRPT